MWTTKFRTHTKPQKKNTPLNFYVLPQQVDVTSWYKIIVKYKEIKIKYYDFVYVVFFGLNFLTQKSYVRVSRRMFLSSLSGFRLLVP